MCPNRTTICVLHENAKHRVPNNVVEICAANSKDYVITTKKCYFVDLIIMVLSTFE